MKENGKTISEERIEDKNISTEPQKLIFSKNNNVNNIDSTENLLLDEQKIFDCQFLNKGRINRINLIINEQKRNIEIQLHLKNKNIDNKEDSEEKEEEYIHLRTINQIDFISFMSEEDISEIKKGGIKNSILASIDNNKEKSNLLEDKEICSLSYFPYISKSKCNCCKCFFCCECKCIKEYKMRELYTDYFLIKTDNVNQIKESLYKISLPKLHELKSKDRKRKILAFVNPIGGKGIALELWERAKKVLNTSNLEIDTIITQQFKEAYNYVLALDPLKYDGFIACSGDGIIHEIINAIFHRNEEDKNKFLEHCAICPLPAGSGNAVSRAISNYSGDDNSIEIHCYYLCKGIKKKIDVQEMKLKNLEKKVYSVVAFMYGFLADCDLESEFIRCIGFFRTTLWGLVRYICLREYLGTIYFLPQDASNDMINNMPNIDENIEDESKYGLIKESDNFNIFITNDIKNSSENICSHPLAELDDGFSDLFMIQEGKGGGRCTLFRYLINDMDNGTFFIDEEKKNVKNGYKYFKSKWWRLIPKKNRNDPDDVNQNYNWTKEYSIDGERYPICPIQCSCLNKKFSFYCGKE